ncbi:DisA checkpoint controller nucleotide-binding [Candidatus Electrothrix aarhusensis]|uniref:DisA checkpoint controller nucleotide-binding n=1 Tax=Candidatus Electrothrix aarhusensis TaxID=1859131 RepID=A0A3S4TAN8_9BACT|nr:DisA checkpoint controller nucleotide-binding [Candidatus Electrothrix aarhusensis]
MKYPKDLPEILKKTINEIKSDHSPPPDLPQDIILNDLLETSYHASFLTEEKRRLGFRLVFANKKDLIKKNDPHFKNPHRTIIFPEPRPFNISEILRLSPAFEMTQVLICVSQTNRSKKDPQLGIWGLLDTGTSWWKLLSHESNHGMPPPNYLTISSTEPGNLSLSAEGIIFFSLRNGEVIEPSWGILQNGPLGDFFKKGSISFYKKVVSELSGKRYDPDGHDEDYPKRFYFHFIERLLFHIRQKGHGGTVFFVPDYLTPKDSRLLDRVNIKYPLDYDEIWKLMVSSIVSHRKYYDLHFPMRKGEQLTKENFIKHSMISSNQDEIDEALSDCVQFVSNLSGVDGAVIITDKFRVIGFGSEVIANSPSLEFVISTEKKKTPIDSFGTRHRSSFRFCSSLEDSVGFIVSSDGGVKATMRVGPDVILWPDINIGGLGL